METVEYCQPREISRMGACVVFSKVLDDNAFIIGIKRHDKVVAFLYFTLFTTYIHINYSFTLPAYRRQGFSMLLRKHLISYASSKHVDKLISVPFENADSVSLLNTLGFIKNENDDAYVLQLT